MPSLISIDPQFHYSFEPPPPKLNENFPKTIDLNENDIFTLDTFLNQYLQAQNNGLPYFLLSIAELTPASKDTPPVYKIFNSASLRSHKYQCLNKEQPFSCPLTRLPIQKIHYIALECFNHIQKESSNNLEFAPKKIDELKNFRFFYPALYEPSGDEELALDALNPYVNKDESADGYVDQKEKQELISQILSDKMFKLLGNLKQLKSKKIKIQFLKKAIKHLHIEAAKWKFCSRLNSMPIPKTEEEI
jgi:hypothetical protein